MMTKKQLIERINKNFKVLTEDVERLAKTQKHILNILNNRF